MSVPQKLEVLLYPKPEQFFDRRKYHPTTVLSKRSSSLVWYATATDDCVGMWDHISIPGISQAQWFGFIVIILRSSLEINTSHWKSYRKVQRDGSSNWQGRWRMGGEIEAEGDEITTLQGRSTEDVELEFRSLSCHHVHATPPSCKLRPPLLNARLVQKAQNTKWRCVCCLDCKVDRGPWQPGLDWWSWFYCSAWPLSTLLLCYNRGWAPAFVSALYEHPYSQNPAAIASHSDQPQDPIRYQFC